MKYRIEAVSWSDAQLDSENETDFNDPVLGKPPPVLSVGILVAETPEAIVLAFEIYRGRKCRTFLTVPKAMVRRRRRIGTVEWG